MAEGKGHTVLIVSGTAMDAKIAARLFAALDVAPENVAGAVPVLAADDGANVEVDGVWKHISRLEGDWLLVVPEETLPHVQAEMSSWGLSGDPIDARGSTEEGQANLMARLASLYQ
jgi:hypothetical protein